MSTLLRVLFIPAWKDGWAAGSSYEREAAAQRLIALPASVWGESLSSIDLEAIFSAVRGEQA